MIKQKVQKFIDSGAKPVPNTRGKSNLILRGPNRSYVQLSKPDGTPTAAGLFWQELTNEVLPQSGVMGQTAVREGNVEYIRTKEGKRATRRLDLASGDWIFTKLGLKYYKTLRRNYVVNVPVIIEGSPNEGKNIQREPLCQSNN